MTPKEIAAMIISVQPMTPSAPLIYALKTRYSSNNLTIKECKLFYYLRMRKIRTGKDMDFQRLACTQYAYVLDFDTRHPSRSRQTEIIDWAQSNCTGKFNYFGVDYGVIWRWVFEDHRDAVRMKLTWF